MRNKMLDMTEQEEPSKVLRFEDPSLAHSSIGVTKWSIDHSQVAFPIKCYARFPHWVKSLRDACFPDCCVDHPFA